MQLIQLGLQLQLVRLSVAGAAIEEAGSLVPGLLPAPWRVQPAWLQYSTHVTKKLLLQALHAVLHLANTEKI